MFYEPSLLNNHNVNSYTENLVELTIKALNIDGITPEYNPNIPFFANNVLNTYQDCFDNLSSIAVILLLLFDIIFRP